MNNNPDPDPEPKPTGNAAAIVFLAFLFLLVIGVLLAAVKVAGIVIFILVVGLAGFYFMVSQW